MDSKKGPKTAIFPDALFLQFPQDLVTFSDMGSYSKRPRKGTFFTRGPVPIHALEKVLTNETPCVFQNIELQCVFNDEVKDEIILIESISKISNCDLF